MKPKILFISAVPSTAFGNFGKDVISGFESLGYDVDYLTKFESKDKHAIAFYPRNRVKDLFLDIKRVLPRPPKFLLDLYHKAYHSSSPTTNHIRNNKGQIIVSPDENTPVISNNVLLSKIDGAYSFVYVYVWQDMITSISLRAIFEKLHVPIVIAGYDFQPFTGGCYYFGNCRNFEKGCGFCPILNSIKKNDITSLNFSIKRDVYHSIKCGVHANPYSMDFIKKTDLFPAERMLITYHPMNENEYVPKNQIECRRKFGISRGKKYVIFARFAGIQHVVKGYDYMIKSVNLFARSLGDKKGEVLLMLAGTQDRTFESQFDIDVLNVGLLNIDQLISAYSAADIFLSTSIDDAGPSMVNQSVMCGTPVLSFNIGSALYMVDNGETGYRVALKDFEAMGNALLEHFNLNESQKFVIKKKCREKGLEMGSIKKFCRSIISLSEKISKEITQN